MQRAPKRQHTPWKHGETTPRHNRKEPQARPSWQHPATAPKRVLDPARRGRRCARTVAGSPAARMSSSRWECAQQRASSVLGHAPMPASPRSGVSRQHARYARRPPRPRKQAPSASYFAGQPQKYSTMERIQRSLVATLFGLPCTGSEGRCVPVCWTNAKQTLETTAPAQPSFTTPRACLGRPRLAPRRR